MSFSDALDALLDLADGRQVLVELPLVGGTEAGRELCACARRRGRGCCGGSRGGARGPRGRGWCRCRRRAARRPGAGSFPAASASPVRATPGCWCRRTNSRSRSCRPCASRRSRSRASRSASPSPAAAPRSDRRRCRSGCPRRRSSGVHAGQVRRAGARVVAGTVAERVAVAVREPGEHERVLAELLERLQDARVLERSSGGRRRPVGHDDAVGHVGEGHPHRRLREPAGAASAGVIASSMGSATAAPMPFRNVRRGRCLRVTIMALALLIGFVPGRSCACLGPVHRSVAELVDDGLVARGRPTRRRDWNGRLLTISSTRPENL